MDRWGKKLCQRCRQPLKSPNSRPSTSGRQEVSWRCDSCGLSFRSFERALQPLHHADCEWIADDQGRPFLKVDVEGWPIETRHCVRHLESLTRGEPWQVVTLEGDRLAALEPVNGGPLDRLIVGLVNRHLAALNGTGPFTDMSRLAAELGKTLGRQPPQLAFEWRPMGEGLDLLAVWLDGWPVQVDASLLGIERDSCWASSGKWYAITADRKRLEWVDEDVEDSIDQIVARIFNDRLALLRDSEAGLEQRKSRKR